MIDKIKKVIDAVALIAAAATASAGQPAGTAEADPPGVEPLGAEQEQRLQELVEASFPKEPELRIIGLFTEVIDEKIAEIAHAMLYLDELNRIKKESRPIEFYISTYGGSADDMFALYDIMRQIKKTTEIHTIGMGKVMSAGVLLLAAGTKGERKIGKYCRVMIHSVIGGSHGSLPNLANEMEAMQQIQKDFCEALVAETSMTEKQLKDLLERKVNVYLSAQEAVELGIADTII
jgi:ATP-dependent Clp protease protease subunit|tara:strand:- start:108 stop:809 length:702 start_codon:yes stop_codon:yes gene_type:complete